MDKRINKLLLKALKSQINPHFLHNIFTSIVLLLKTGRIDKATDMLVSTADFLKTGLYGTEDLVQLEEEIKHAVSFVNIQNIRYNGQMQCTMEIDSVFKTCQVPKFILQPLIENAIHHGMKSSHTLHIQVKCMYTEENQLIIRIEDNGCGMTNEKLTSVISDMLNQTQTDHYGLSNVNERIQLEFGQSYGLTIYSHPDEGAVVEVHLPFIKGVMKHVGIYADDRG